MGDSFGEISGVRDNSHPLSLICDMTIENVNLFVGLGVSKLFTQLNERGVFSEEFFQFDDSVHEPKGFAIIVFNYILVSFLWGRAGVVSASETADTNFSVCGAIWCLPFKAFAKEIFLTLDWSELNEFWNLFLFKEGAPFLGWIFGNFAQRCELARCPVS
ncbi:hypothetical protein TNCV_5108041 [Trichonephila clavipes]|nr:hypothetical protein TNCV_5108041 [Trichonephila clavipes]